MTTRTTFQFKFPRLFSKNRHPGKLHCTFFTTKVRKLISVEGGEALSRSLINGIRAKTRSKMAFTLSRQNDVGSRSRTSKYWENLVFVLEF